MTWFRHRSLLVACEPTNPNELKEYSVSHSECKHDEDALSFEGVGECKDRRKEQRWIVKNVIFLKLVKSDATRMPPCKSNKSAHTLSENRREPKKIVAFREEKENQMFGGCVSNSDKKISRLFNDFLLNNNR